MNQPVKVCATCRRELPATPEHFHRQRDTRDGFRGSCKACRRDHLPRKPEPVKEGYRRCTQCGRVLPATLCYFHAEAEGLLGLRSECKECRRAYKRRYRESHQLERRIYNRAYHSVNRTLLNEQRNARRHRDVNLRLNHLMSAHLSHAIRSDGGGSAWMRLVGYSAAELRAHLEAQFRPGMTWENYGSSWHVDHIRPVASFNIKSLGDPQLRQCWALANLQPLWAIDNFRKGAKWGDDVLAVQGKSNGQVS